MLSTEIKLELLVPEIPYERRIHVAGRTALILYKQYDPDQSWFDFKDGVVFIFAAIDPPPPRPEHDPFKVARSAKSTYARLDPVYRRMVSLVDHAIDQMLLPFYEHRAISAKQAKRYEEANWPGFQRTPSGALCVIQFPQNQRETVEAWCLANCTGRYRVGKWQAVFENQIDGVQAKLLFQRTVSPSFVR